ncbi:MAG: hypothetical protein PHP03_03490 [Candidatus Pacebacteria bacterium]|nr:hypothetical protein [Candidatus Paceibacterota bacterium]
MQVYSYQHKVVISKKNKRSMSGIRIKFYLILFLIVLLAMGLFYLIVYSPIFRIQSFNFKNNEKSSDETILNVLRPMILNNALKSFLGINNILVWPSGTIDLNKTLVSRAEISKNWLKRTIDLDIQERKKFAIWCVSERNNCYWLDQESVIFEQAPITEGNLIPMVQDIKRAALVLGKRVVEDRFSANVYEILRAVRELNFPFENITYDNDLQEISAKIKNGPNILFSIRFNPQFNIDVLKKLTANAQFKNYRYADLRVENKIFYQ